MYDGYVGRITLKSRLAVLFPCCLVRADVYGVQGGIESVILQHVAKQHCLDPAFRTVCVVEIQDAVCPVCHACPEYCEWPSIRGLEFYGSGAASCQ